MEYYNGLLRSEVNDYINFFPFMLHDYIIIIARQIIVTYKNLSCEYKNMVIGKTHNFSLNFIDTKKPEMNFTHHRFEGP